MGSLYELSNDLIEIQQLEIEDDQIEQVKSIIKKEIENKSSGIIGLVRNIEVEVDAIKAEIDRLNNLKRIKENRINNIKKYTKECLEEANIKKVNTPLGNITVRNNPKSVDIIDEDLIPDTYKKEVITFKVDKKAIGDNLKAGEIVPGATLKGSTSLIIK